MRLLIDIQCLQTESRSRPVGVYVSELVHAFIRRADPSDAIWLLLNETLADSLEDIRHAFAQSVPAHRICTFGTAGYVAESDANNADRARLTEIFRDTAISWIQPDVVLVANLFEGFTSQASVSIGAGPTRFKTAVLLHHSIPLEASDEYRFDPARLAWHQRKLDSLRQADLLLSTNELMHQQVVDQFARSRDTTVLLKKVTSSHDDEPTQTISWNDVADQALIALRALQQTSLLVSDDNTVTRGRKRLAMVSPLPPSRTGIADYCAEITPALAAFYDIDLITDQEDADESWLPKNVKIHSVQWFEKRASKFDRIIYHIGNSPFHTFMVDLLGRHPGVVVLHDFFNGDMLEWWRKRSQISDIDFAKNVFDMHGYSGAICDTRMGRNEAIDRFPFNMKVIERASVVVAHSRFAQQLARQWHGELIANRFATLPFPRRKKNLPTRDVARASLGIAPDAWVVCSFGMVGPYKMTLEVLQAWCSSSFGNDANCQLIFVGANHGAEYGEKAGEFIANHKGRSKVRITGHVTTEQYEWYLAAADVAVQCRLNSRGETSAAVFDALTAGLPLIVNHHGSLTELPDEVVLRLPEFFAAPDLASALQQLRDDSALRERLSERGQRYAIERHDPAIVAEQFSRIIEQSLHTSVSSQLAATKAAALRWARADIRAESELAMVANVTSRLLDRPTQQRLFIDVSAVARLDLQTGIQRTVRALLLELLQSEPNGYRVEPVYIDQDIKSYRHASLYIAHLIGFLPTERAEDVVQAEAGDIFVGLDLVGDWLASVQPWFRRQRLRGMKTYFTVYDLLPVIHPKYFPVSTDIEFRRWLETITEISDGLICISEAVADDVIEWISNYQPARLTPISVSHFHLGADLKASAPTAGLPEDAQSILQAIGSRQSFLMVGTVEPRKGHVQVLDAFEHLWRSERDVGLVIVGKIGWMMDDFAARMQNHPEYGRRLFWLNRVSDEYLEQIYDKSTALIAASVGEGFGLPLIEAAQQDLPIICRDLKVFREVAGANAHYFSGDSGDALAQSIESWLQLADANAAPQSTGMRWLSWRESASQFIDCLLQGARSKVVDAHRRGIAPHELLMFDSAKLDWQGWAVVEPEHRWNNGRQARIGFRLKPDEPWNGQACLRAGTLGNQRVIVKWNGRVLNDITMTIGDADWKITAPKEAIKIGEINWLEFGFPNARSPGFGEARQLALFVRSIRFS